jgi:hypothetical protein
VSEPLSEEYIATAVRDARRFQGQWCGTSGNLAAHVMRLVNERKRMLEATRSSGVADAAGTAAEVSAAWAKYKKDGPVERAVYGAMGDVAAVPDGHGQTREQTPAEQLCEKTAEVIRDRRPKYGGPQKHFARTVGMFNAAFADVLKRPLTEADWAVVMILDKVARFRGPGATIDGPVDIAGYAACLYEVMDRSDQ